MAKALALGADAIAIGTGAMIALNCNKEIPESNFEKEMGVPAGHCYHCHTGRCPVGVATQDPKLRKRLNPDDAEEGTIRKKYGISIDKNSVHGSDSVENAKIEIDFFFKD